MQSSRVRRSALLLALVCLLSQAWIGEVLAWPTGFVDPGVIPPGGRVDYPLDARDWPDGWGITVHGSKPIPCVWLALESNQNFTVSAYKFHGLKTVEIPASHLTNKEPYTLRIASDVPVYLGGTDTDDTVSSDTVGGRYYT